MYSDDAILYVLLGGAVQDEGHDGPQRYFLRSPQIACQAVRRDLFSDSLDNGYSDPSLLLYAFKHHAKSVYPFLATTVIHGSEGW